MKRRTPFKDQFSDQSSVYRAYRPDYPDELFSFLASLTAHHDAAWDCATGSGQSAKGLAPYFKRVLATDASARQLEHALRHPNINYEHAPAETCSAQDNSFDLISVAQAAHWFDHEQFYSEVFRVLKPDGIIALWAYHLPDIDHRIDRVIEKLYGDILGTWWEPEVRHIQNSYSTLPFPFEPIPTPGFTMTAAWTLADLEGYLESWSASAAFRKSTGENPVEQIQDELRSLWRCSDTVKSVSWKLILLAGKKPHRYQGARTEAR
ncbi:MAG: class I SAM-dependent methyltransferase [Prosthecochloris sp.]|nr:class I SAM-dependent methyltransferase [Prosthecochloris sp.]